MNSTDDPMSELLLINLAVSTLRSSIPALVTVFENTDRSKADTYEIGYNLNQAVCDTEHRLTYEECMTVAELFSRFGSTAYIGARGGFGRLIRENTLPLASNLVSVIAQSLSECGRCRYRAAIDLKDTDLKPIWNIWTGDVCGDEADCQFFAKGEFRIVPVTLTREAVEEAVGRDIEDDRVSGWLESLRVDELSNEETQVGLMVFYEEDYLEEEMQEDQVNEERLN